MVRRSMIAEVMAGWRSTKAMASSIRLSPASSARWARASAASSLRWFSGVEMSKRSGSRCARLDGCWPASLRHRPDSQPPARGL